MNIKKIFLLTLLPVFTVIFLISPKPAKAEGMSGIRVHVQNPQGTPIFGANVKVETLSPNASYTYLNMASPTPPYRLSCSKAAFLNDGPLPNDLLMAPVLGWGTDYLGNWSIPGFGGYQGPYLSSLWDAWGASSYCNPFRVTVNKDGYNTNSGTFVLSTLSINSYNITLTPVPPPPPPVKPSCVLNVVNAGGTQPSGVVGPNGSQESNAIHVPNNTSVYTNYTTTNATSATYDLYANHNLTPIGEWPAPIPTNIGSGSSVFRHILTSNGSSAGIYGFILYVSGSGGKANCYATVIVDPTPVPAPTCSISANPDPTNYGGTSTISWTSTNATSGTYLKFVNGTLMMSNVNAGPKGQVTDSSVYPFNLYKVVVSGPGGTATCQKSVTTIAPPPPVTLGLGAKPTTINRGQSTTITYAPNNAKYCWAWTNSPQTSTSNNTTPTSTMPPLPPGNNQGWYGWMDSSSGIHTAVVPPLVTTTYMMRCGDGVTETTKATTVIVNQPVALELTAKPTTIDRGQSATITYTPTKAKWCWASTVPNQTPNSNNPTPTSTMPPLPPDGWSGWVNPADGPHNVVVHPLDTTIYTLRCGDGITETIRSTYVIVNNPVHLEINAKPQAVWMGQPTTIFYAPTNAKWCWAWTQSAGLSYPTFVPPAPSKWYGWMNPVNGVHSVVDSPFSSTMYYMVCGDGITETRQATMVYLLNTPIQPPTPLPSPTPTPLTCQLTFKPSTIVGGSSTNLSWSTNKEGATIDIDDTTTSAANDIGTGLKAPGDRTFQFRDIGTHTFKGTAHLAGSADVTCTTNLIVQAKTGQ